MTKHAPDVDVLSDMAQLHRISTMNEARCRPEKNFDLLAGALWDVMQPGSDLQEDIHNTELGIDAGTGDDAF